MKFTVRILGSSSAAPTATRNPSAQVVNIHDRVFMIDCGEGTQMQMRRFGIKSSRINHIFISHLHADHYLGLAGMLYTWHLYARKETLHIYANSVLEDIIRLQLDASNTRLHYPLEFHSLSEGKSELLYEDKALSVSSFPLLHRVPTHGFIFREKTGERKIKVDALKDISIPYSEFPKLKAGLDITDNNGNTLNNSDYTEDPAPPRSYAYCSDTGFTTSIIPYIHGADLLYHEASFGNELEAMALEKQHSTAAQAAEIARKAAVKKLLIGHFSSRYPDVQILVDEASAIFQNTEAVEDGMLVSIELND